jgi:hypothetical protein
LTAARQKPGVCCPHSFTGPSSLALKFREFAATVALSESAPDFLGVWRRFMDVPSDEHERTLAFAEIAL